MICFFPALSPFLRKSSNFNTDNDVGTKIKEAYSDMG